MAIAAGTYDSVYERAEVRYGLALADGVSAATAALRCSGFVTANEPKLITNALRPLLPERAPSRLLVDLGCGTGLLGATVAETLNVSLAGCDFSPAAIRLARSYVPHGFFTVASFDSLPFRDASVLALMSHDALYLAATDQALSEIARVLCNGAPMLFSTYRSAIARTWSLAFWSEKLAEHGMRVRSIVDDTRRWRSVMQRRHSARWQHRERLISMLGAAVAPELSVSARMIGADGAPPFIGSTSRFVITATRS